MRTVLGRKKKRRIEKRGPDTEKREGLRSLVSRWNLDVPNKAEKLLRNTLAEGRGGNTGFLRKPS